MATLRDQDIEAEARAILREMIEREVEYHWHLARADAVKRLEQRRGRSSDV